MSKPVLSDLDFTGGARILNLPAPASANEPARLADLNSVSEGLAWKDSARVKTTGNLNLASPGATIDGVTMAASDRVLVGSQTAPAENGIYIWNGAAVAMTRAADASTSAELEQATLTVEEGTSAGTGWRQSSVNFTLDSGAVAFAAFGVVAPPASESTAGIAEIATQGEADAGTDDARMMTALKAKSATWAPKRYATDVGDGSATSYTVTHNLGTRDVTVMVRRNSGNYEEVLVDTNVLTTNTVQVVFATAPTSAQFRVIVIA